MKEATVYIAEGKKEFSLLVQGSADKKSKIIIRSKYTIEATAEQSVALGPAGIMAFRNITLLAAGPAGESSRWLERLVIK